MIVYHANGVAILWERIQLNISEVSGLGSLALNRKHPSAVRYRTIPVR